MLTSDEVRRRLLVRRAELAQRAARTTADLRHEGDPLSADFAEQAVQRENEDVLRGIGGSAREELQRVNRALERLDRGVYFVCARCGEPIGSGRLLAVPTAELCASCATVPEHSQGMDSGGVL